MNQIDYSQARLNLNEYPMHDNMTLRMLVTLPAIQQSNSTEVALPPELPPKKSVTGDKEVDAVLWLQDVVATGDSNYIAMALESVNAIKTPMKELGNRYGDFLNATQNSLVACFASFNFGNLQALGLRATKKAQLKHEALSRFGTVEELFAHTPAEKSCIKSLRGIKLKKGYWSLPQDLCNKRFLEKPELMPATLNDCLYEISYWNDLYSLRNSFGNYDHELQISARSYFLEEHMLARIPPRDKHEAINVLEYLLSDKDRLDRDCSDAILRNLVGGTEK
jgi:hypothetical protein